LNGTKNSNEKNVFQLFVINVSDQDIFIVIITRKMIPDLTFFMGNVKEIALFFAVKKCMETFENVNCETKRKLSHPNSK
jgi:hypothetical protein